MPRDFVAAFCFVEHRQWLSEPGKRGPHREKPQRTIRHEWISDFHKRSERLEDPTSDVASSNDDWLLGMAAEFRTSFRPAHRLLVAVLDTS